MFAVYPADLKNSVGVLAFVSESPIRSQKAFAPLNNLYRQIIEISSDEDEDAPPNQVSVCSTIALCQTSAAILGHRWPKPRVATDGFGGLRLSWRSGKSELRAVISGSELRDSYLYWQNEAGYGSTNNFTGVTLFSHLERMVGGKSLGEAGRLS